MLDMRVILRDIPPVTAGGLWRGRALMSVLVPRLVRSVDRSGGVVATACASPERKTTKTHRNCNATLVLRLAPDVSVPRRDDSHR